MFNSAFSSGIQALHAYSQSFAAITDNVSNVRTVGYKDTQMQFQDLVANKARGNNVRGSGFDKLSGVRPVARSYARHEGLTVFSGRNLDAVLEGKGFFLTSEKLDGTGDKLLTAAGRFGVGVPPGVKDNQAYIVDQNGHYLLGWLYNAKDGTFNKGNGNFDSLSPIPANARDAQNEGREAIAAELNPAGLAADAFARFANLTKYEAIATTEGSARFNLPSEAKIGAEHTISIGVFDGSGLESNANPANRNIKDERDLRLTWTKIAPSQWAMTVKGKDGEVTEPEVKDIDIKVDGKDRKIMAHKTVTFDAQGKIKKPEPDALGPDTFDANGKFKIKINWKDTNASNDITFDFSEVSQLAGPFNVNWSKANGAPEGALQDVKFGKNGAVLGLYTNGLERPIAKIPAADVVSPEHLDRVSGTQFMATSKSGDIKLYEITNKTTRVNFQPQAFESSSTDLAEEMTNMIITQRAYSSAATMLKTIDEMFKTTTDIK